MLSPANTYVCLTQGGPGCDKTEPDKYYPSGTRNYARVVANDAYQGGADAEFAQSEGVKNVFILNDKEAYGLGVATNFQNAAKSLGIEVAGFASYDPKASSYEALFKKIQATGADAVFIGGLICENGAQLIKDKVAVLGANDGDVKLLTPDGFTTQQTIDDAGSASAGMYMSVAGQPIDKFQGAARTFATNFSKEYLNGKTIDPYAIYGAPGGAGHARRDRRFGRLTQRRDQRRCSRRRSTNGLLGSFGFSANGDPDGGERSGRRHHDLQGDGQARDRQGDLAEAGDGQRGARRVSRTRRSRASARLRHGWRAGEHCPPASFLF